MSKTAVVPEAVREIERKYEAPAEQEVPALGGLPGVVGEPVHDSIQLTATYFDTADYRLLAEKITLRKRPCIITMAEMRGAEAVDTREAARTGHTVISSLHANSASQAYSRIMTMCQMGDETISVQILMHTIVDAFPIAVFCGEAGTHHRCVLQIVEAYGVMDGQVRTNVLFQYEEDESGWRWVRKKGISKRLAEILLNHRADPKTVELLMAEPGR